MLNVLWLNPLVSFSVFVATVSLLLQYLSSRSTALDSDCEREEKIDGKIKKLGNLFTDEFTAEDHTIELEFIKSTVNESDGLRYQIWKYINPFLDIQGKTRLNFKITQPLDLDPGDYEITGDFEHASLGQVTLRVMPNTASLLFVTVNSVIISEVAKSLTEIDSIESLKIQQKKENISSECEDLKTDSTQTDV
jgi:hypothetical protein